MEQAIGRSLCFGQYARKSAAESGTRHHIADLVLGPGRDMPRLPASGGNQGFIGGTHGLAGTGKGHELQQCLPESVISWHFCKLLPTLTEQERLPP